MGEKLYKAISHQPSKILQCRARRFSEAFFTKLHPAMYIAQLWIPTQKIANVFLKMKLNY